MLKRGGRFHCLLKRGGVKEGREVPLSVKEGR